MTNRCDCGMAIGRGYTWCESCEHGECPGCGNGLFRIQPSGAEVKDRGRFCDTCVEDGVDNETIAASDRHFGATTP